MGSEVSSYHAEMLLMTAHDWDEAEVQEFPQVAGDA